ncbi:cytochrome P450 [Pseudonocardia sp. KRD291]|uniref:cytochrome P450 family protein n=1 Tax=Pseudonocardia sp. KRD291 TaxID=2792007 RepID=UPI001C4A1FF0|nr:cytochrome P450 [Pseudonocardia sp. KRD291]MBW0102233.1 cytochrome P450 [Pseudonocardia sp. KRD291]
MSTTTTPDDGVTAAAPGSTGCPVTDFGRLRETGPVVDVPGIGTRGAHMVTRHDDVRAMLTDPRFRSDAGSVDGAENAVSALFAQIGIPPDLDFLGANLLTRDGADHTRLRKLVSRAFTVRRVNDLRPRVETITDGLLDDVAAAAAGGRAVDLVAAFSYPLPIAVICELVGVPEDMRPAWRELGRLMVAPEPERMPEAARAVVAQVRQLISERRAEPADDLVTALVRVHSDDGDRLTEREMTTLVFDLVTAGFETTAHLISKATLALLTRPDQVAALRSDPELWPRAVHELVRTCGPIPTSLPRYAAADVRVGDVTVAEGSTVMAGLLTANFDPRVRDRPEDLDVRRDTGRGEGHLGFGQGAHYCLGAALARQETEVALRALFDRFDDLRLAEPDEEPSQLGFARLTELQIRV